MDRDDFIIAVFLVVCEHYQVIKKEYRLRRGGFAPALTDEVELPRFSGHREACGLWGTSIQVPRDRKGEFEPQVVKKQVANTNELEDKIIGMYATLAPHCKCR